MKNPNPFSLKNNGTIILIYRIGAFILISLGLLDYGYKKEAQKIINDTVMNILSCYENDGVIYECYDPLRKTAPSRLKRKGDSIFAYLPEIKIQAIRDFGTTSSVCAQMILSSVKPKND